MHQMHLELRTLISVDLAAVVYLVLEMRTQSDSSIPSLQVWKRRHSCLSSQMGKWCNSLTSFESGSQPDLRSLLLSNAAL